MINKGHQPPEPGDADYGPRISAFLDGQLMPEDAAQVRATIDANAGLAREVAELRQVNVLLRAWYAGLPDEAQAEAVQSSPLTVPKPGFLRRGLWSALATAAAAVLFVLLAIPALRTRESTSLAEEVVERTARAFDKAQGLHAKFEAVYERHRAEDGPGELGERRTAAGDILMGPLDAKPLSFISTQKWQDPDGAELLRRWGQHAGTQWLVEQTADSMISEAIYDEFAPIEPSEFTTKGAAASAVDVRTQRAVEGLAVLVSSFRRDGFLQWMGHKWRAHGGKGTRAAPWVYVYDPALLLQEEALEIPAKAIAAPRAKWTLRTGVSATTGLIDFIELEEQVVDAQTGDTTSVFRTSYTLTVRAEPWPEKTFRPEYDTADEHDN